MSVDVQGQALSVLSKLAQADWPDRLKVRKSFEKLVYSGSRASFRLAAGRAASKPREARPAADDLFDLSLSDEQQMLVDMLQGFALEVLRPAAHEADAQARVPAALINQAHELGLAHYGVSEAQGGLAGERTVLSNALIAESLAQGDFSLAAALLVPLSAANCIRRWGTAEQQATWLPAFIGEESCAGLRKRIQGKRDKCGMVWSGVGYIGMEFCKTVAMGENANRAASPRQLGNQPGLSALQNPLLYR